jgi:hypothetical protein
MTSMITPPTTPPTTPEKAIINLNIPIPYAEKETRYIQYGLLLLFFCFNINVLNLYNNNLIYKIQKKVVRTVLFVNEFT